MLRKQNIVYVNFSQYDNVGRILDFLKENFSVVIHFSYDHLRLKHGRPASYLRLYEKGILIKEKKLLGMRTPDALRYPSLPLVALVMVIQTIYYVYILKRQYKKFHYFLTLNAFSAWIGNILRDIKLVKKTIFWVGDYFPPTFHEWKMRIARKVYWKFDQMSMKKADKLVFTNKKILDYFKKEKIIKNKTNFLVVPIGCMIASTFNKTRGDCIIGFLGMLKDSQGLEFILDAFPKIKKKNSISKT